MRIAVLEHFTALPERRRNPVLEAEGRAMRDAVVADLRRLPGVEVAIVERRRTFRETVRRADAALVIAPEEGGALERLCRAVEEEGRILLGPSAAAVRLAADKWRTARLLAAAGIQTPRTEAIPFAAARARLRGWPPPFVLKPRDGCGARGISLVRRRGEIDRALARARRATTRPDLLVQQYLPGEDASVSVLAGTGPGRPLLVLGLGRQIVARGDRLVYLGGEVPWPHPHARAAARAAQDAVGALARAAAGVRGYLGVDLVLGPQGVSVIEVNPRLTNSYVGLRRVIRENLAGLIARAALGRALPSRPTVDGRCRFRADGTVSETTGEERWPTTSAGTSAASI